MKKRIEKQPLDDLFARKLADMSLPPSPDGFARLQARMGQGQPEARVVFWRNPIVQRYMAAAACLVLACLFGWLYLSTGPSSQEKTTVAANEPNESPAQTHPGILPIAEPEREVATAPSAPEYAAPDLSDTERAISPAERSRSAVTATTDNSHVAHVNRTSRSTKPLSQNAPTVVSVKPLEQIAQTNLSTPLTEPDRENQPVAAVATKAAPAAERVLVVTIAEPEALVAARQVVKTQPEEKGETATADKLEKDAKPATLWQQMKRLKQGEVFARKDVGEDDRGLLGRAYNGLKQTFDKEKTTKQ